MQPTVKEDNTSNTIIKLEKIKANTSKPITQHEFVDHSTTNRQPYWFTTFTSRVDYCNLLLAGAPKSVTDKLQRVMNAAARVVSGMKKYDRGLTHLLHSELH